VTVEVVRGYLSVLLNWFLVTVSSNPLSGRYQKKRKKSTIWNAEAVHKSLFRMAADTINNELVVVHETDHTICKNSSTLACYCYDITQRNAGSYLPYTNCVCMRSSFQREEKKYIILNASTAPPILDSLV
jgi:hypothetical protein